MSSETVRVVARLTARPETAAELGSVLQGLVGPTRKEVGCISYELLRSNKDVCDFVFVEEWASNTALDTHLTTPHLKDTLARAKPLLAKDTEISRYSLFA